jgi:hypothetical protein
VVLCEQTELFGIHITPISFHVHEIIGNTRKIE